MARRSRSKTRRTTRTARTRTAARAAAPRRSRDGKSVVLSDRSRGSIGAQQMQPAKGPQVRESVSGRRR